MRLWLKLSAAFKEWRLEREAVGFEKAGGKYVRAAIDVIGIGGIALGIGLVAVPAGVIAAGVGCWIISWRIKELG